MSAEQWQPVPGFPEYRVSDHGRVISNKWGPWRELRGWLDADGYRRVDLRSGGRRWRAAVHRLVASVFVGPRPKGHEVRHLDGDKTNNASANLAYGTKSQNVLDQVQHGVHNMASKTRCRNEHSFTAENTYISPEGYRHCRTCRTAARRRFNARQLRAAGIAGMTPNAASAVLAMSTASTPDEAIGWAATAVLRGASAEEAHTAYELWCEQHADGVQTVVSQA